MNHSDVATLIEAQQRQANALELGVRIQQEILSLAKEETSHPVEPGPPVCPNCGAVDPFVTEPMREEAGSGPLSGYIFKGETHCCNKAIYGVPSGWFLFGKRHDLEAFMESLGAIAERAEANVH